MTIYRQLDYGIELETPHISCWNESAGPNLVGDFFFTRAPSFTNPKLESKGWIWLRWGSALVGQEF